MRRPNKTHQVLSLAGAMTVLSLCSFAPQGKSFDEEMAAFVKEMNKQFPKVMDSTSRMDSVSSLPGRVFRYHYTMIQHDKNNFDTAVFRKAVAPVLLSKAKEGMQYFAENGITLVYIYNDKNGNFLIEEVLPPGMYKN